jgi:hypothetical protein
MIRLKDLLKEVETTWPAHMPHPKGIGKLNVKHGTRPDPGWTNPMGGDRDAYRDTKDNTAWYEALNHARQAIQELTPHVEALQKIEDSAGEQETNLRISEILETMKDCLDELKRETGTGTIIPMSPPQSWPPGGQ